MFSDASRTPMKKSLIPVALLHDAYWAIQPDAARVLLSQLGATDADAHEAQVEARRPSALIGEDQPAEEAPYQMAGPVAIIPISGVITKRPVSFGGMTSTVETRRLVRRAASDPNVRSVLLLVDSPGGSISGLMDLADDLAALARKKQLVTYYEDCGCSAALWLGSMGSEVYCNSAAQVGSIGIYTYTVDSSAAYESVGVKVHLLTTGEFKGAGAIDGVPITDEQLAKMQETVDAIYDQFVGCVAKGRGMSRAKARELATGEAWIGEAAVAVGLVDAVASLDDVLQAMMGRASKTRTRADTSTDFHSLGQLHTDGPLKTALDSVLTAAIEVTDAAQAVSPRITEIIGMRRSQDRQFSPERLEQVQAARDAFHGALTAFDGLLSEAQALGKNLDDTPESATDLSATDKRARDAAFERAIADAQFDLATTA